MHDLRRQALESAKTVSRKAKSRQVSAATSRNGSTVASSNGSRVASTNTSEDEADLSDTTSFSANSIDELHAQELSAPPDVWTRRLCDLIDGFIDRKRSSTQGREDCLQALTYLLMAHCTHNVLKSRLSALLPALLKSIKSGQSEREVLLAIKVLALALITDPTESSCAYAHAPLRQIIVDAELASVKTAAIHALGLTTFYGGLIDAETEDVMAFLIEIVESDGAAVGADDHGAVVTAALEEWAFIATQLDDMQDSSAEPMEAFVDQLESADVAVQIAAGENIALLYEKSYTAQEDDEEAPVTVTGDVDSSDEDAEEPGQTRMIKRYNVYYNEHQLRLSLEALAKSSSRRMSKRDKRWLHTSFADFLNSVQHPTRGPRYSKALNAETGRHYGSRLSVGVGGKEFLRIRTWEQWHRLKALRRVLQSGFLVHYSDNEVVFYTLPVMLQGA